MQIQRLLTIVEQKKDVVPMPRIPKFEKQKLAFQFIDAQKGIGAHTSRDSIKQMLEMENNQRAFVLQEHDTGRRKFLALTLDELVDMNLALPEDCRHFYEVAMICRLGSPYCAFRSGRYF